MLWVCLYAISETEQSIKHPATRFNLRLGITCVETVGIALWLDCPDSDTEQQS